MISFVRAARAALLSTCVLASLGGGALAAPPAPTCTAQNIRGYPTSGTVCGGSMHAHSCTPGAVYECKSGALGQTDNCKLLRACVTGCQTGPTTGNIVDSCLSGPAPLTLSTTNTLGGNEIGVGITLAAAHAGIAYVNLKINRGDLVPGAYCSGRDLAQGVSSANFALPTAVVPAATDVTFWDDISFTDASGSTHEVVSTPTVLTLNGGGTEPPAPAIASFTLSPSSVAAGGSSVMNVRLTHMAPARGIAVNVASSDPSVAWVNANAQPKVLGGCTEGGGSFTISTASTVAQTSTLSIGATSGDPAQTVVANPFTVRAQ
jgi:hypothetical protein